MALSPSAAKHSDHAATLANAQHQRTASRPARIPAQPETDGQEPQRRHTGCRNSFPRPAADRRKQTRSKSSFPFPALQVFVVPMPCRKAKKAEGMERAVRRFILSKESPPLSLCAGRSQHGYRQKDAYSRRFTARLQQQHADNT